MIGSDSIGLLFRASGDTSSAKKAFNDLSDSIKKDSDKIKKDVETGAGDAGSSFSSLAGFAGSAAVGIAAVTTAAVAVGAALFSLAKTTAETGKEIANFQKLTGFTAESIAAIKTASESAGVSLGEFEGSYESLVETLLEGAKGADDAKEKLKAAGIDPQKGFKDLEGSVQKAFDAIRNATTQAEKADIAMKLFGDSSLSMVKVADKMTGGFEQYKKKLVETGVVMDQEGIRASEEFSKNLKALETQAASVGTQFALGFMPSITSAMEEISGSLRGNKSVWREWGEEVGEIITRLVRGSKVALAFLKDLAQGNFINYDNSVKALQENADAYDKDERRKQRQAVSSDPKRAPFLVQQDADIEKFGASSFKPDDKKKREEDLKKRIDELAKYNSLKIDAERKAFEIEQKNLETSLENKKIAFDEYVQKVTENLNNFSNNVSNLMQNGFQLDVKGKKGQERSNIEQAYANAQIAFGAEIDNQRVILTKKEDEAEKKKVEKKLTSVARLVEINKQETEKQIKLAEIELAQTVDIGNQKLQAEKAFIVKSDDLKYQSFVYERSLYQELLKNKALTDEQRLELEKNVADISHKITIDNNEITLRNVKNYTEAQRKAKEDYLQIRREIIDAERELQDSLNATARAALVDELERSYGAARLKNLAALRDFDIAEAERQAEQRQDDLAAELDASLERIRNTENEQSQKAEIIKLYREKALISEAEFEKRRAEIRRDFSNNAPTSGIQQVGNLVSGLFGGEDQENLKLYTALGNELTNTFNSMAQAVGNSVKAFVLFGSAGGSLRKFAAEMLATIAQMAAVQAIWNLAEGFAKLAMAFFGHPTAGASATQHFIAAGVYAAIGGVAAIAGRSVAGNRFQSQNQGAFGSANTQQNGQREGAAESGVYSSNRDKLILDMARNSASERPPQVIEVHDKTGMGFEDFLAYKIRSNGPFRYAIKNLIADD